MSFSVARVIVASLVAFLGLAAVAPPAYAIKQFYAGLRAKYVRPDSKEDNDIALNIAVDQAGCTICHPGDDKHRLTRYGGLLATRINKFDKGNKKKIQEALEEVGTIRSDPYDQNSPTYGGLFQQGKLPPNPMR